MTLLLLIIVATASHSVWGSPLRGDGEYMLAPTGASPPCARTGTTFCEAVDKYPTDLIQKLLQSKPFDQSSLYLDESQGLQNPPEYVLYPTPSKRNTGNSSSRKTRSIRSSSDDHPAKLEKEVSDTHNDCQAVLKTIRPKAAQNHLGQWRYVAKISEPLQVQLCSDLRSHCSQQCTQQYSLRPLLSLHPAGRLTEDLFFLPSICACAKHHEDLTHPTKMDT